MEPHQLRVITEKAELDLKREKLWEFIQKSQIFAGLPLDEQGRMKRQLSYMDQYSQVLGERIAAFGEPPSPSTPPA